MKKFDLGTPDKPVLSYFHAKIPPIEQWTTSNFLTFTYRNSGRLIDFVIDDCCFRIRVQSFHRKMNIKSCNKLKRIHKVTKNELLVYIVYI